MKLACLNDIAFHLNSLNKLLQGQFTAMIDSVDNVKAFTMSHSRWHSTIKERNFNMFHHLSAVFQEEETGHGNLGQPVQAYMSSMQEFQTYFSNLSALDSNLIRSMWISLRRRSLSDDDGFWRFVNDSTARDSFEVLPLAKFLSKMSESYPSVAIVPMVALLMFPSTYLLEQGFSAMFCMKTKFPARLCTKDDLRVSLSKTVYRIEALGLTRQAQPSHWGDFSNTDFLSYLHSGYNCVHLVNKMCITELDVECRFVYNAISL